MTWTSLPYRARRSESCQGGLQGRKGYRPEPPTPPPLSHPGYAASITFSTLMCAYSNWSDFTAHAPCGTDVAFCAICRCRTGYLNPPGTLRFQAVPPGEPGAAIAQIHHHHPHHSEGNFHPTTHLIRVASYIGGAAPVPPRDPRDAQPVTRRTGRCGPTTPPPPPGPPRASSAASPPPSATTCSPSAYGGSSAPDRS